MSVGVVPASSGARGPRGCVAVKLPGCSTKKLRRIVGAIVVLGTVGVGLYRIAAGATLSPFFMLLLGVVILSSAIGLYGKGTVDAAVDAVKELRDGDERES
jgi:hypothetical protein